MNALVSSSDAQSSLASEEAEIARLHLIRYLRELFGKETVSESESLSERHASLAAGLWE